MLQSSRDATARYRPRSGVPIGGTSSNSWPGLAWRTLPPTVTLEVCGVGSVGSRGPGLGLAVGGRAEEASQGWGIRGNVHRIAGSPCMLLYLIGLGSFGRSWSLGW